MSEKQLAMERLGNIFDVHGAQTSAHFQKRLVRAVFILQNMTSKDCTKKQITEVSQAIEELYNVFEPAD